MSQESLEERFANLERANGESERKLAEAKAKIQSMEKDLEAGKLDKAGLERVKAEIGRTLALIVPELEMAKAVQKKLVAENEALEKQVAAINVETIFCKQLQN